MIFVYLVNVGGVNDTHTGRSVDYRHCHVQQNWSRRRIVPLWVCSAAQQVCMRRIEFFKPAGRNVRLFVHIAAGTSPTRTAIITYALHVGGLATLPMCGRVGEETGGKQTHLQKSCKDPKWIQLWDSTRFPEEASTFNDTLDYRVMCLNLWFLLSGIIM